MTEGPTPCHVLFAVAKTVNNAGYYRSHAEKYEDDRAVFSTTGHLSRILGIIVDENGVIDMISCVRLKITLVRYCVDMILIIYAILVIIFIIYMLLSDIGNMRIYGNVATVSGGSADAEDQNHQA